MTNVCYELHQNTDNVEVLITRVTKAFIFLSPYVKLTLPLQNNNKALLISICVDQSRVNPVNITVSKGENAEFTCTNNNNEKTYWYKEGISFPYQIGSVLRFHPANLKNEGYYECRSKNEELEEFNARVYLRVKCKFICNIK